MQSTLKLSSADLYEAPAHELAGAVSRSSSVVLELRSLPHRIELLRLAQLIVFAETIGSSLRIVNRTSGDSPESAVAEWYREAIERRDGDSADTVSSPEARTLVIAPCRFPLSSRFAFQGFLLRRLVAAGIRLPESLSATLATIAFEAAVNAEEHGSVREPPSDATPIRLFAACVRTKGRDVFPSEASEYLYAYTSSGHEEPAHWLEMVVMDSGVGIAYPSFRSYAATVGREDNDLYRTTFAEERMRTQLLLRSGSSTKGEWGRSINRETAAGAGKQLIRLQLTAVRGFASCTAGRTKSTCWYAKATRSPDDIAAFTGYEVIDEPQPLMRGTLWRVLIPIDQQFKLPFR